VNDRLKWLEGEVQVSLINEPVEEPKCETAEARALRRWFTERLFVLTKLELDADRRR